MRSLFFLSVMNGAPWGGSEELWYRTALRAAAQGFKVGCAFYEWEEKKEKAEALQNAGCRVYLLTNKGRSKTNLAERIQYKLSKWQLKRAIPSISFQDYELVVVNLGGLEIYTPVWRDALRYLPAYVLLFHSYSEGEFFKPAKAEALRRWISAAAANLFAARRIKSMLEEKLNLNIVNAGLFINPVTIVPPAMPPPYPSLKDSVVFVMLAELDVSRKAQDNLLKALSSPKWKERSWELRLYGKGRNHQMLQQLIIKFGLGEKALLKGHISDVESVLQQAHLVLQLTHSDAMPLAVMEAMAMSRPVVVSRVGDMPYWVEEGRNGWIADDASVEKIDETLENAWQHKEQWMQAGQESFRLFKEKFPTSPEDALLHRLQEAVKA